MSDTTTWVRAYSCALWELADIFWCGPNVLWMFWCGPNVLWMFWTGPNDLLGIWGLLWENSQRSNQSILKEINPEYSLEGMRLKLRLQHFGHLLGRTDSMEKILMLGKIEGRRRGWQKMTWCVHHGLNGHEFEQTPGDSGGQVCCSPWGHIE